MPLIYCNANTVKRILDRSATPPYRPLDLFDVLPDPIYSCGYLVFGAFEELFTNPVYARFQFEAINNFQIYNCPLCNKTYYSQTFQDYNGNMSTFYFNIECNVSPTGYHDGLNIIYISPPDPGIIYEN